MPPILLPRSRSCFATGWRPHRKQPSEQCPGADDRAAK